MRGTFAIGAVSYASTASFMPLGLPSYAVCDLDGGVCRVVVGMNMTGDQSTGEDAGFRMGC